MVMEGRAPKDYVEGFWTEVENMRLDEVERRVDAVAERNEQLRRKEDVRRRMSATGVKVYGSLGEWFEDYKEGKTTAVDYLGAEGDGEDEDEDEDCEKWSVGQAEGEAVYGAAGDDGDVVGLARHIRPRNGLRDSRSSGDDGDLQDDDNVADGEELQDSSEDEEALDDEGDTTMLDDEPKDILSLKQRLEDLRKREKA